MNIDEKIDSLINAVAELTSKCDGTFQRIESMEKILENTASSITTLSTTVSELLRESTSHKNKILNLGKKFAALQQENRQLKEVCMRMQNYIRRWDLRIYGVKESGPDKLFMNVMTNQRHSDEFRARIRNNKVQKCVRRRKISISQFKQLQEL